MNIAIPVIAVVAATIIVYLVWKQQVLSDTVVELGERVDCLALSARAARPPADHGPAGADSRVFRPVPLRFPPDNDRHDSEDEESVIVEMHKDAAAGTANRGEAAAAAGPVPIVAAPVVPDPVLLDSEQDAAVGAVPDAPSEPVLEANDPRDPGERANVNLPSAV